MIGSGPFGIPVLRQLRTLHRETERINHKRCDWRGQYSFGLHPHCLLLPCPLSALPVYRQCTIVTVSLCLYTVSVLLWPCHFACIPSVYYYDAGLVGIFMVAAFIRMIRRRIGFENNVLRAISLCWQGWTKYTSKNDAAIWNQGKQK